MSLSDLVEKFRSVALDRVEKMNTLLVDIEQNGADSVIDELQREIHTLKGEAKMMGFADVNLVSHLTEHLILDASGRDFDVEAMFTETMYEGLDILRALLTKSPAGASAPIDLTGFVDRVTEIRRSDGNKQSISEASDAFKEVRTGKRKKVDDASLLRIQTSGSTRVDLGKLERLGEVTGEILLTARRLGFQASELDRLRVSYIRMRDRLDDLLPNSLIHETRAFGHELDAWLAEFRANIAQAEQWGMHLDGQTRELRHLPLEHALQHYPRAVRDLATSQGKQVRFEQDVAGVEVDRLVLNGLADPLLHLVRNAVDHGIEDPEERVAAGKSPEGRLQLIAEMSGDSIRVILSDDGAGIDPQVIGRKAVERGLIDGPTSRQMNDDELLSLIFEPGFSTRDHVTDVSGRGIGMDIVRRQIGAIGGTVELESTPGVGTTFTLVLPVSSSVGSVLTFMVDGRVFAIPSKDVERVDFVEYAALVDGTSVEVQVREDRFEHVPLLDWRKLLNTVKRDTPRGLLTLVFIRRGSRSVVLWVDDVLGERDAMTRPLGQFLAGVRVCRGVAITNAGAVVPLLNVNELLSAENTASSDPRRAVRATLELPRAPRPHRVLVVEDSEITRALVTGILVEMGLKVVEAEDGWIGWQTLQEQDFDLVLTDVQMPRVDGLELLEKIRNAPEFAELPVVILTTLGEAADKERALKLGASAYLVKLNFEEKELIRTVQRFLQ